MLRSLKIFKRRPLKILYLRSALHNRNKFVTYCFIFFVVHIEGTAISMQYLQCIFLMYILNLFYCNNKCFLIAAVIANITCNLLQWNTAYREQMQSEPNYSYLPALPLHFRCIYLQCRCSRPKGTSSLRPQAILKFQHLNSFDYRVRYKPQLFLTRSMQIILYSEPK